MAPVGQAPGQPGSHQHQTQQRHRRQADRHCNERDMAETLRAPGNVGDLILVVDDIEERKIGTSVALVVVGRQALGILLGGLCRDIGQNVVSLRSRLRGLLVCGYWCPPELRGGRPADTMMAGDGGGFFVGRSPIRKKRFGCTSQPNALAGSDFSLTRITKYLAGTSVASACFIPAQMEPLRHAPVPQGPVALRAAVAAGCSNGGANVLAHTSSRTRR